MEPRLFSQNIDLLCVVFMLSDIRPLRMQNEELYFFKLSREQTTFSTFCMDDQADL